MITPNLTYIYDRMKRGTAKKAASVELRITYGREQVYISTGVKCLPKQWRHGMVVGREDCFEMNNTLNQLMVKVRGIVNALLMAGNFELKAVKARLEREKMEQQTFIDYCKKRAKARCGANRESTLRRYMVFLDWFERWGKIRLFSDVTEAKVKEMENDLKKKGMKTVSRYSNYHKFLKAFCIDALGDGLIQTNPYVRLKIEKSDSNGLERYLLPEELHKIEACELPTECLERVRDLFVFQTYTCLSYTDMSDFDEKRIKTICGAKVYTARRNKTGQEFSFVLLKPALAVLEKYKGKLPMISNVKYNLYLKAIAQHAGIDKPISTHWARHTGATLLLNDGKVPMEVVSKILGHSTTRETEKVYAKLLDRTIAEAMKAYDAKL